MEKIKLQKRELTGKKIKQMREKDLIPAVIYNSKGDSTNLSLEKGIAIQLYRVATPTTILDVEIEGKDSKAIIKDFDINPKTTELLHVSFFEIDPKVVMDFTLPFTLKGVSPAVKNNLGILIQVSDSVKVRGKLEDLIAEIVIDVSHLDHPGQTISMEDIELPKGLELVHEGDEAMPIATITQLQKVEVVEEEEAKDEEGEEAEEGEETEGEQEGDTTEGEGTDSKTPTEE
ncbi:MAG: 50S ribosomal protein L25 [Candidatus Dojkabacteria bacterium]|jgi:large subunit ribosomal protein L25|nr:50S ribosomal protein L25 [Candidatus Dojkabacteria bacterium]